MSGLVVTCHCENWPVGQVLDHILAGTGFQYVEADGQILIELGSRTSEVRPGVTPVGVRRPILDAAALQAIPTGNPAQAQQVGTISGRVVDSRTLQALAAAQVFIPALNLGVLTRADGRYLLVNVPDGTHAVQVQLLGYRAGSGQATVSTGESATLDFQLEAEALALEAVVVTGTPGGTQRRALGNVVSRVDAASIQEAAGTGIEQVIGNSVTGVRMMGPAGAAGGATSIRIRGSSSLALSGDPLIYVDGIRMNANKAFDDRGSATSRLQDIDPSTIESVEIIKGPAAATLYGTEAANGVIQIITKRGVSGDATFDASVELGANWQPNPERNFGLQYYRDPATGEIRSHNLYLLEQEPDRFGKSLFQKGPIQRYNASVRGGSDLFRYFAAVNRTSEEGFSRGDWTQGWRAQMSLTAVPREGLSLTINSTRTARDTRDMGSVMCSYACWALPSTVDLPQRGAARPYEAQLGGVDDVRSSNRFSWSAEANHSPASWFKQRLVAGVDDAELRRVYFIPKGANGYEQFWGTSGLEGVRRIWEVQTPTRTVDYSATLTLSVLDGLRSNTSFGLQWFNRQENEVFAEGSNFAVSALETVGAAAERQSDERFVENTTLGTFVQNEFNWLDRFFITGAVRFDDNSAFGTNYDAAIYPKVSASWVLSEEAFFPAGLRDRGVSQLRLRGAWGQSGKQPDVFAAQRLYEPMTGPGGQPMLSRQAFGNPDLGPEKGEELELGLDASFLEDRLGLEFTWYRRTTRDGIVSKPVRPSVGFPGIQFVNVGQTRNWGTETALRAALVAEGPVRWDMDLGLTTMGNRIDDLGGLDRILVVALSGMPSRDQYHVEGFPIAALFTKRVLSAEFVEGNQGNVTNVMCDGGTGRGGFEMGGVPVPCDDAPAVYYGQVDPTWQVYLRSNWALGDHWRLSASIDAQGGNVMNADYLGGQNTRFSEKYVRGDDLYFQANSQYSRGAEVIHDAGFAKLREVSLQYSVPNRFAERLGVNAASVRASMYNVATLWIEQKYVQSGQRIWDPEMNSPNYNYPGVATGSPPPMSNATVQVNVSF